MKNAAYESYAQKCKELELSPSSKERLEQNEEVMDVILDRGGRYITVTKAKEFAARAYDIGYAQAMREMAS